MKTFTLRPQRLSGEISENLTPALSLEGRGGRKTHDTSQARKQIDENS